MSFGATAWLWSGVALALPILLHLLGRGRGRREVWPNIRLLRETGLASGARWRPSQPALLALRCALVATVTLALAEPWLHEHGAGKTVWLLEPGVTRPVSGPVRYLAPGFPTTDPSPRSPGPADAWSLLSEADGRFPDTEAFHVLARPRIGALIGTRPTLHHAVQWSAPAQSIRGVAPVPDRTLHYHVDASAARRDDAAFLRQGLSSAASTLGWTLDEVRAEDADLLIGLGQEPAVANHALRPAVLLLADAPGTLHTCRGLVDTGCCGAFQIWQCGAEPAGRGIWRDGSGLRVLSRSVTQGHDTLQLATRFVPEAARWSTASFVALLERLTGASDGALDATATTVDQATPERSRAGSPPASVNAAAGGSLAEALWILTAVLFAAERWLAYRSATRKAAA